MLRASEKVRAGGPRRPSPGWGWSALEIRGKTNEPARQRNQGGALRPLGRVQTLALQRRSEPASADHIVLQHSAEDRPRWRMLSGNAFRYLLHREQQIVDERDERIGAIEDAVERFGSHSGASPYGDYYDWPESTLHLELAGHGAVPYRQGNTNRNGESQCGWVVSRRAYNEKDQIEASDYPEEMSNGVTAEQHHPSRV